MSVTSFEVSADSDTAKRALLRGDFDISPTSQAGFDPIGLVTALNAEDDDSLVRVDRRVRRDDVKMELGVRGETKPPVQASMGAAVNLVHGVVSDDELEARV